MTRKHVETFSPLAVAKSLLAQNDAVVRLVGNTKTLIDLSQRVTTLAKLQALVANMQPAVDDAAAAMWPEEE